MTARLARHLEYPDDVVKWLSKPNDASQSDPVPVSELDEADERAINMIQAAFEERGWQPFDPEEEPPADAPQSD